LSEESPTILFKGLRLTLAGSVDSALRQSEPSSNQ